MKDRLRMDSKFPQLKMGFNGVAPSFCNATLRLQCSILGLSYCLQRFFVRPPNRRCNAEDVNNASDWRAKIPARRSIRAARRRGACAFTWGCSISARGLQAGEVPHFRRLGRVGQCRQLAMAGSRRRRGTNRLLISGGGKHRAIFRESTAPWSRGCCRSCRCTPPVHFMSTHFALRPLDSTRSTSSLKDLIGRSSISRRSAFFRHRSLPRGDQRASGLCSCSGARNHRASYAPPPCRACSGGAIARALCDGASPAIRDPALTAPTKPRRPFGD